MQKTDSRICKKNNNINRANCIATLTFLFLIFSISCAKENEKDIVLTIASKQVHIPEDAINPSQYIVKFEGKKEWELLYNSIEGFDYKKGYEYVINVKVIKISNPPMDAGTKEYKLNYIISCEEKESEGIPESWFNQNFNY